MRHLVHLSIRSARTRHLSVVASLASLASLAWLPCVVALGAVACGSSSGAGSSGGAGGGGDGENADGGVVSGGKNPPAGCNGNAEPDQDPCVVTDGVGIFASSSQGQDNADGTREHPLRALQKALDLAKAAGGKNVYACAEPFAEAITLPSGVSAFGYFDCASDWKVTPDHHALIQPATSPAVSATDVTDPTVFAAFDVVAPAGTMKAPTSIAFVAKNATGLRIAKSHIQAGNGFDGADGVEGTQLVDSPSKNGAPGLLESTCQLGVVSCAANGGDCEDPACYVPHDNPTAGGTNACTGAPRHAAGGGGGGGRGGHWTKQGSDMCHWFASSGFSDMSYLAFALVGAGEAGSNGAAGGAARSDDQRVHNTTVCPGFGNTDGASGASGTSGGDGSSATAPGSLTATGYTPTDGTAGSDGSPGAGGGGGGGSLPLNYPVYGTGVNTWGIVGSGGGAGGCPGLAGTPGKGGGASIGLFMTDGALVLDATTIQAGDGGRGGEGTFGSNSTSGGAGGFTKEPGPSSPNSGNSAGGHGGDGGRAGVSGSGAGGPSIAVAYHGAQPSLINGATALPGKPGQGQPARAHSDGVRIIPASASGGAEASVGF